jgi:predicted nucleic acid-binding protein
VLDAYRGQAFISPQILHEYFVVATRKLGISAAVAQQHVRDMAELDQAIIDPQVVLRAIDCHRLNSLSYWDALVVTCAADTGCVYVLSEDMQNGQTINGVRIENPFV